jgi:hypothetical protein
MFNGPVQTVEVRASDPHAEIIANGTVIGTGKAEVTGSPTDPPVVYVRAKDGRTARAPIESSIGTGWVVLDVICGLTIIGIAAPIADATFNGWASLDGPVDVKLEPASPRPKRSIEYAVLVPEDATRYAR